MIWGGFGSSEKWKKLEVVWDGVRWTPLTLSAPTSSLTSTFPHLLGFINIMYPLRSKVYLLAI